MRRPIVAPCAPPVGSQIIWDCAGLQHSLHSPPQMLARFLLLCASLAQPVCSHRGGPARPVLHTSVCLLLLMVCFSRLLCCAVLCAAQTKDQPELSLPAPEACEHLGDTLAGPAAVVLSQLLASYIEDIQEDTFLTADSSVFSSSAGAHQHSAVHCCMVGLAQQEPQSVISGCNVPQKTAGPHFEIELFTCHSKIAGGYAY